MADEDDYEIEDFELTDDDGEDSALNFGDDSSVPPAQFGNNQTVISGTISGMQWGEFGGSFYAKNGLGVVPKPPLADTVGGAGLLVSAEFKKLQGKKPTLISGTLNLPLAQAPTGACNGTVDDTPGGIVGIGYSEDGVFSIKDGYARIPRPATYEFDSDWFEVVDGQVRLKQEALASVVEELADEMSVEVTGTGLLEQTYAGTLKANTAGSLTLDTLVTY